MRDSWGPRRKRNGKHLKLSFVDIQKAYFNGKPKRSLYVRLPPELGLPKDALKGRKKESDVMIDAAIAEIDAAA